jgi:isocitrate/isopropylmalate dehydrogenase
MRYPHGPRDAEALAVHPDGSIYILTKRDRPPQLFRLTKDQWMRADGRIQTLERVAAIDLMKLGADNATQGAQPTALDIWRDGTKALVLTYREAFELFVDFSKPIPPVDVWKSGREYRKIDIVALRQQEGLSYAGNDRTLVYDSELASEPTAPIMRSVCR